ncbi:MAG: GlsB/YeaQ/YmgE family stress response membrane protein [Propionibacteriaceae bacterium]|nr:GlsB/YeaQ/YmgE family stress response membrane protein [Propionibacteriaceae bacterium]
MGTFAFLILGAIAGSIARILLPGRIGGGLLKAMFFGAIGALVGGWLSTLAFNVSLGTFWDLRTWVIAIAGSALVLLVWGALTGKKR